MGISNYVPSSRLSQAGVCTSSTRPASPYEGQMIYETDTDLTYLYSGSVWTQVSGSTVTGNSGLVVVKTQTVGTGVSSVTVNSAFSATYDNYLVHYSGGVSSQACDFRLEIGGVSSASYDTNLYYQYWGTGTIYTAAESNLGYFPWAGTATTDASLMSVTIFNPYLTDYTYMSTDSWYIDAGLGRGFGRLKTSASYTSFKITPVNATLTGGTIVVYGFRKS